MAKVIVKAGMRALLADKERRQDQLISVMKSGRQSSNSNLWISPEKLRNAKPSFGR
jgi:hypothetical protein